MPTRPVPTNQPTFDFKYDSDFVSNLINSYECIQLPPGDYLISEPLPTLHEGQSINGATRYNCSRDQGRTRFVQHYTSDDFANDGIIAMDTDASHCTIRNIDFWTDNIESNTDLAPIIDTFPYAIQLYGSFNLVEDCTINNLPRGIRARADATTIRNVYGLPALIGLYADECGNTFTVDNVSFNNPCYPIGAGVSAYITYCKANGTGFKFGRIDGLNCNNLIGGFYNIGIHATTTDSGAFAGIYGIVGGSFTNTILDGLGTCWLIDASVNLSITGNYFIGRDRAMVLDSQVYSGAAWSRVKMSNVEIVPSSGATLPAIQVNGGYLQLSNITYEIGNTDVPFLNADLGKVHIANSVFTSSLGTVVTIGSSCESGSVVACSGAFGKVSNNAISNYSAGLMV